MDTVIRIQKMDENDYISQSTYTLRKDKNPPILPLDKGK